MNLGEYEATLAIPLCARAMEARRSRPIICDPHALRLVGALGIECESLAIPRQTQITLCMRARQIDRWISRFLEQHDDAVVIQLGSGLDTRFERLDNGRVIWYELDLPSVASLRSELLPEDPRQRTLGYSVTDFAWMDQIETKDSPVTVVAEGLLMYLSEESVGELVSHLAEGFRESHLIFDCYSVMTARNIGRHPSLRRTGASVKWGMDDAGKLPGMERGFRLEEEWSFTQSEDVALLPAPYRLAFVIAHLIPAARRAHRLLRYRSIR